MGGRGGRSKVGRLGGGGARWEWGGQVGGRGGLGWRSKVRWEVLGGRSGVGGFRWGEGGTL